MSLGLDELKQQRGTTKGSITRLKNYIDSKTDNLSSTELNCRLGILEAYFKQVLSYQTQIEILNPKDTGRAELEDLYVSVKTKIVTLLGTQGSSNATLGDTTVSFQHPMNHLPKIKLPKFSGTYTEYQNFIHLFSTLVDKDVSLSKTEKFNHLLSCSTDQALSTVKTLQITEDNYSKALERLKERYDNSTMIFLEYISKLFELPPVPKGSPVHLRSLVDTTTALFNSLQSLGSFENIFNAIIIYIALSKVDSDTRSKWDEILDYQKLPTWKECSDVLNKRCQFLEVREKKPMRIESNQTAHNKFNNGPKHRFPTSLHATQTKCLFCHENDHSINRCPKFIKLSPLERYSSVKKLGLCLNCLGKGHGVSSCQSTFRCKHCKFPHNSLLHRQQAESSHRTREEHIGSTSNVAIEQDHASTSPSVATSNTALEQDQNSYNQVILATALVLTQDSSGGFQLGRALLDSGSQVNFINESFAKSLQLQRQRKQIGIVGIGVTKTNIQYQTQSVIRSRFSDFEMSLEFLFAPSITGYQPESELRVRNWNIPKNIELADECFFQPSRIDLLLGAEAFFEMLEVGQVKLGQHFPSLQKTSFGWIVSGKYRNLPDLHGASATCCYSQKDEQLDRFVEKFWELEELQVSNSKWTEEQKQCEHHFIENIEVLDNGRLMVKLPFKMDPNCLGSSYDIAFRRFLALERKLSKNPSLKSQYSLFLKEYESLGHMSVIPEPELAEPHYYLPHQCVIRSESVSTKLRVVFDASCCTSSRVSLNGLLMVGPTIQNDLLNILMRFRLHRYALTADIVKMYRQVLIHPSHRKFQLILWRDCEQTPIRTYQLNTVTYGTSSAPFLAIRGLQYLADKNKDEFELGSQTIQSDFYVDDMLTGADSLETMARLKAEVVKVLGSAGFNLAKWNSNCADIFNEVTSTNKDISLNDCNLTSTLGIAWNSSSDEFNFSYKPNRVFASFTKRNILSLSSLLFDPMGLVSPIIIKAKIILQRLWIEKLDWDAPIPKCLENEWRLLMNDLHAIKDLTVPRHTLIADFKDFQVHGFADASMDAYGCCIYLRSTDSFGSIRCRLLVAKSRVAPTRKKQLPRLELCAAHLLSKLWDKTKHIFNYAPSEVYLWTDSSIVLHWIFTHSSKLSTFVGNRVSEIQEKTMNAQWKHVPTQSNPADIISRGCSVQELKTPIWFEGPKFLLKEETNWPNLFEVQLSSEELLLEKKKTVLICQKPESNYMLEVIERFSSYTKLLRVVAYMLRFCKKIEVDYVYETSSLQVLELEKALRHIVFVVQTNSFARRCQF